jgi:hypothetical protein
VNAFWSVTDGKTQLLTENRISRYLINSPMLAELKKNADSGVDGVDQDLSSEVAMLHQERGAQNPSRSSRGCPPCGSPEDEDEGVRQVA